jgi:hypothetical protein
MSKIQISKPTFLFQAGLLVKCINKAIHSTKKSMLLSLKKLSVFGGGISTNNRPKYSNVQRSEKEQSSIFNIFYLRIKSETQ